MKITKKLSKNEKLCRKVENRKSREIERMAKKLLFETERENKE